MTTQTTKRASKVLRLNREDQIYWRKKIEMLNGLVRGKRQLENISVMAGTIQEIADELERVML